MTHTRLVQTAPLILGGMVLLGVVIGAYGTLIGAGGGFVLVPALLLLFPRDSPAQVTAISLAVVLANSASGSLSYFRLRRADYRSGIWLAAATLPGAVLGAVVIGAIPRGAFNLVMGGGLVAVAAFLVVRPHSRLTLFPTGRFVVHRRVTDAAGRSYAYDFNLGAAMLVSVGVGFVSSVLGIGGGIIHVPALTTFFAFPEHVATATSHFVLVFMAGAATATHVLQGNYAGNVGITIALAVGAVIGAPAGAALSSRLHARWIVRLLAIALGVVGIRLLTLGAVA